MSLSRSLRSVSIFNISRYETWFLVEIDKPFQTGLSMLKGSLASPILHFTFSSVNSSSDCDNITQTIETFDIFQILAIQPDFVLLLAIISSHHFGFLFAYPEAGLLYNPCQVIGFGLHMLQFLRKEASSA